MADAKAAAASDLERRDEAQRAAVLHRSAVNDIEAGRKKVRPYPLDG